MLADGAEMTIAGCTNRAREVYACAIATNESRPRLARLLVTVQVWLPLLLMIMCSQQFLYCTGLAYMYVMEPDSSWRTVCPAKKSKVVVR